MKQEVPAAKELTRRLLAVEAGEGRGPKDRGDAAQRAADKLRAHLSQLIGPAGFQALLDRALALARAEFPWLAEARSEPEGTLEGLRAAAWGRDPAEVTEGMEAVLAHLLGLLFAFIGDALSRRLLSAVWPELSRDDAGSGAEETRG